MTLVAVLWGVRPASVDRHLEHTRLLAHLLHSRVPALTHRACVLQETTSKQRQNNTVTSRQVRSSIWSSFSQTPRSYLATDGPWWSFRNRQCSRGWSDWGFMWLLRNRPWSTVRRQVWSTNFTTFLQTKSYLQWHSIWWSVVQESNVQPTKLTLHYLQV